MFSIKKGSLPDDALQLKYVWDGAYVNCYMTNVRGVVSDIAYVAVFYTTSLFKFEWLILIGLCPNHQRMLKQDQWPREQLVASPQGLSRTAAKITF